MAVLHAKTMLWQCMLLLYMAQSHTASETYNIIENNNNKGFAAKMLKLNFNIRYKER